MVIYRIMEARLTCPHSEQRAADLNQKSPKRLAPGGISFTNSQ